MENHPNRSRLETDRWAIRCTPHYYAGDIHKRDREYLVTCLCGPGEQTIVLGSEEDAETLCKVLGYWRGGVRRLDDNQYATPEYRVQRYRGSYPAISLLDAARHLGYGFGDNGDFLSDEQLHHKIEEMTNYKSGTRAASQTAPFLQRESNMKMESIFEVGKFDTRGTFKGKGWWYQLDSGPLVGPYETKGEAERASRGAAFLQADKARARAAIEQHGLNPIEDPIENGHHTDAPFTLEDREIGQLSYWLGGLFIDKETADPNKPLGETYWYNEMTSHDQWQRVARALRIHGLRIVNAKPSK